MIYILAPNSRIADTVVHEIAQRDGWTQLKYDVTHRYVFPSNIRERFIGTRGQEVVVVTGSRIWLPGAYAQCLRILREYGPVWEIKITLHKR